MRGLAALLIAGGAAAQFGAALHPYDWEVEYFFEETWDVNFWLLAGCSLLLVAALVTAAGSRPQMAGAFAAGAASVMASLWLSPILVGRDGDIPGELWVALLGAAAALAGGLMAMAEKDQGGAVASTTNSPEKAIPAGWYPDPSGAGHRWWDGSAWTEHVRAE